VAAFGIDYRAPQDARRLPGDLQIDCFFSNEVLEHIPEPVLEEIFEALKGNLRPGGLALHRIDYTDHFARSDATASRFNFLTYSDPEWAPYNTSFQYVNRLRHSDFERLFARAGWTIRHQERRAHEPDPAILGRLADRFRTYTPEDLFVASGYFVLQPETAG
jgi:SAM-dependent methyltransferase